jgi:hypothetical protein
MYLAHHRTMLPKSRKTHNSKVHDQDISPEQREGEKSTHESSSTNPQPTRPPMAVPYHNPRDQSCHEGEEDWRSEEANKAAAPGAFLAAEFIPRRPRQGRTGAGGRHWQLRNGINAGNGCLLGERDGSTKRKGSRRFFFCRRVASRPTMGGENDRGSHSGRGGWGLGRRKMLLLLLTHCRGFDDADQLGLGGPASQNTNCPS